MKIELGYYKHYKNKLYSVSGTAKNTETLEDMVIYKAMYGDHDNWVRPLSMFLETIIVDGKEIKRFTKISIKEAIDLMRQDG